MSTFLELQPDVDDVLLESDDALVELVDVGGCAQTGLAPALLAERLGESPLQMLDASGEPDGTFVCGEQVGLQRRATDDRSDAEGVGWMGFSGVHSLEKIAVPVEERAVDPGLSGDGADADVLSAAGGRVEDSQGRVRVGVGCRPGGRAAALGRPG